MVQLIVGKKGKGKTKQLLDKVNAEIKTANGSIVYIDKSSKHMYELNNKIRLIDASTYPLKNSDEFIGFICGIISQDHDIEQMYLDSFLKVAKLEGEDITECIGQLENICKLYDITFVLSECVRTSSTRFFRKEEFRSELEKLSDHPIIDSIVESEKIGPAKAHDLMVIAPATANTVSKLANGIYDGSVTLAAKAMLRNERPVLIGMSTNDFIGASGANLLRLKPCIEVEDGGMKVGKKFRGKLGDVLEDYVATRLKGRVDLDLTRVFITHSGIAQGHIDRVRRKVEEYADFKEILVTRAGCTVSNHCGPNTLGVLFLTE